MYLLTLSTDKYSIPAETVFPKNVKKCDIFEGPKKPQNRYFSRPFKKGHFSVMRYALYKSIIAMHWLSMQYIENFYL